MAGVVTLAGGDRFTQDTVQVAAVTPQSGQATRPLRRQDGEDPELDGLQQPSGTTRGERTEDVALR